jgi:hypothetical protein
LSFQDEEYVLELIMIDITIVCQERLAELNECSGCACSIPVEFVVEPATQKNKNKHQELRNLFAMMHPTSLSEAKYQQMANRFQTWYMGKNISFVSGDSICHVMSRHEFHEWYVNHFAPRRGVSDCIVQRNEFLKYTLEEEKKMGNTSLILDHALHLTIILMLHSYNPTAPKNSIRHITSIFRNASTVGFQTCENKFTRPFQSMVWNTKVQPYVPNETMMRQWRQAVESPIELVYGFRELDHLSPTDLVMRCFYRHPRGLQPDDTFNQYLCAHIHKEEELAHEMKALVPFLPYAHPTQKITYMCLVLGAISPAHMSPLLVDIGGTDLFDNLSDEETTARHILVSLWHLCVDLHRNHSISWSKLEETIKLTNKLPHSIAVVSGNIVNLRRNENEKPLSAVLIWVQLMWYRFIDVLAYYMHHSMHHSMLIPVIKLMLEKENFGQQAIVSTIWSQRYPWLSSLTFENDKCDQNQHLACQRYIEDNICLARIFWEDGQREWELVYPENPNPIIDSILYSNTYSSIFKSENHYRVFLHPADVPFWQTTWAEIEFIDEPTLIYQGKRYPIIKNDQPLGCINEWWVDMFSALCFISFNFK